MAENEHQAGGEEGPEDGTVPTFASDHKNGDSPQAGGDSPRNVDGPQVSGDSPQSQRPVRVGWVAGKGTFTDVGRLLAPLAIGLMDELVTATIFLPEDADRRELPTVPANLVTYSRLQWLVFHTRMLSVLAHEIGNAQIDLLHALDAGAAGLTRQLADIAGLPYVVSCYGLGDSRRLGTVDEHCQAVLAASEPIRRELVGSRVAPENKVLLVRPGVYMVSHATCYTDQAKSVSIVAGGQLDDFEAYEAMLRAFDEVRRRNYDCMFFIIGNGKAEGRIRQAAQKMEMRSRLTFVDRQETAQLQGILKSADVYISPCPSEHVDIASLLAMAAGNPVLAARDVVDDFLIDERTAKIFTSGNAAELTGKLCSILEDRSAGTALAESALAYLREHHTAAQMVSAVAGAYRSASEAKLVQAVDGGT